MLAFIIAIVKAGGISSSLNTIASVIVYAIIMIYVVKPMLGKMAARGTDVVMKRSVCNGDDFCSAVTECILL